jgi:hypothetical protein
MANVPISNLTTTWNAAGTTFTGLKLNVTDTASAAASLLADFQVGGVSKFNITKAGALSSAVDASNGSPLAIYQAVSTNTGVSLGNAGSNPEVGISVGGASFYLGKAGLNSFGRPICVTSNVSNPQANGFSLYADAANTLAQRNSTAAQTFRLYNTYTDASNYTRLSIGFAAGNCSIKPENAGTGSAANLLISGLPTSNPGPGILWNNAGVVNVGT